MILNFLWRKLRTTEKQNIPFLGGDQGLVERKQIYMGPQIQGVKASKELEALEVWTFPAKVTCCSLARRLGIAFKLEFEFWEFLALAQKGRENEKERTKSKFIQHWRKFLKNNPEVEKIDFCSQQYSQLIEWCKPSSYFKQSNLTLLKTPASTPILLIHN